MTALDPRGLPPGYPFKPDLEVAPRDARDLLARTDAPILLDVRNPFEWDYSRIQAATPIPLAELEARFEELDPERPVLTLCHHGIRSIKAALFLRQKGIDARSIAGGIDLWSLTVDPGIRRYDKGEGRCTPHQGP